MGSCLFVTRLKASTRMSVETMIVFMMSVRYLEPLASDVLRQL